MLDRRLLAAIVVALVTVGCGLASSVPESQQAGRPMAAPYEAPPETPVTAALIDIDVLDLQAVEADLIDQALISTTTTLFVETTTTAPAPTTTERTARSTAPPATSAPQTAPPATSPPTTTGPTAGATHDSGAESQFASSINSYRSSNGLPPLTRSGSLDSYARAWAQQMVANGGLSHSNLGSLLGEWSAVGENIGYGGSVGSVFDALAASSAHRGNMLGDYTHVGIGAYRSSGVLWTVHVFAR